MSGIAGILRLDGKEAQTHDLQAMAESLSHRGPDGAHYFADGPLGLAHLEKTSKEKSSPTYFFDQHAVALDGRIDNLNFILQELHKKGVTEPETSTFNPAELILKAYLHLDRFSPDMLHGDFAFALWDKEKQKLLLARDPCGVKPLYYAVHENCLLFSSEAKGILSVSGVPCEPDPVRLKEFKTFRFRAHDRTFFKDIQTLPGGEMLETNGEDLHQEKYFKLDPNKTIQFSNRDEYAKTFRELFFQAVRCRLPKDGTVAISISGGLDSSSILAAAVKIKNEERPHLKIRTLSILSRNLPDEREWIDLVCKHCGVENVSVYFEDPNPKENLQEAFRTQEDPMYNIQDTVQAHLYSKARSLGARVMLSGEWGDVLLTGMAYLADLLRERDLKTFLKELKMLPKNDGGNYQEILKRVVWYLFLPNGIYDQYEGLGYFLKKLLGMRPKKQDIPVFPSATQKELFDGVFSPLDQIRIESLDRHAAQCGVEVRFPFLDRDLLEFCIAIPDKLKVRDGLGKRILREALADILPDAIVKRNTKGDYTDMVHERLKGLGFSHPHFKGSDKLWQNQALKVWKDAWKC